MKTPARPRSAARPYLTLCVPALAAGLAAGAHAQEAKQPGTVIEGSVDVYNWAPADKSHAVEAKDINLRRDRKLQRNILLVGQDKRPRPNALRLSRVTL